MNAAPAGDLDQSNKTPSAFYLIEIESWPFYYKIDAFGVNFVVEGLFGAPAA